MKKSELESCPHCGYSAKLVEDEGAYKVFCLNPACDAQYGWCASKEQAVNGWNRRKDGETDSCPHCGHSAKLVKDEGAYKVFCLNPACDAQYGWCASKEQAVNGWNKRAGEAE